MASIHLLFDPTNDWLSPFILPHLQSLSDGHGITHGLSAEAAGGHDVLFILGYTKLLKPEILAKNGINLVIHESALPKGRGFSPVQWQIMEGAGSIPVCLIEATAAADAGDIIDSTTIELEGHELWTEIRALQADATLHLMRRFLEAYPNYRRTPQSGTPSNYRRRRSEDDALDPDKTIREQFNHLRIADNDRYPVYFDLAGHRYLIKIIKDIR